MRGERGALSTSWIAGLAAVTIGGVGLGVALGGSGDDADDVVVPAEVAANAGGADLFDCPDARVVGTAAPGDRIQATGVSDDGSWVELRDPRNLSARVWIDRAAIDPDRALTDLAIRACGERVAFAGGSTAPTVQPIATTSTSSATTTIGGGDSTAVPTSAPNTTGTTPPTTNPPDTTPPQISGIVKDTEHIYEDVPGVCIGHPTTVEVQATVTDASGVAGVTLHWSVGPLAGEVAMSREGSSWSATIGPLADTAVTYPDDRDPLSFEIRAVDEAGNIREASNGLDVFDCTFI